MQSNTLTLIWSRCLAFFEIILYNNSIVTQLHNPNLRCSSVFLIKASITLGSAVSLLFLISVCIEVTRISTDFSCFWTGTALSKSLRETRSVVFCGFFFFFSSSGLKKKKKVYKYSVINWPKQERGPGKHSDCLTKAVSNPPEVSEGF